MSHPRSPMEWFSDTSTRSRSRRLNLALVFALASLALVACSQTSPSSPRPAKTAWIWEPIGYSASSDGTNVEVADSAEGQTVVVKGEGSDIFGSTDSFVYTYRELTGDGYLEAQLGGFDAPDEWSKAGIMIREGLDPSARNAFVLVSGNMGAVFQVRGDTGGATEVKAYDATRVSGDTWLRLSKQGDTVLAELSQDGYSWTSFATATLPGAKRLLIGFAVAANSAAAPTSAVATFRAVHFDGATPEGPAPEDPGTPTPPTDPTPEKPSAPTPARGFDLPAATMYVSPSGQASSSGRDPSSPTSLSHAASTVRPGDVVYLGGGVYPIMINFGVSGTRDNPIIWASKPGEWAIFDGKGLAGGVAPDKMRLNADWNVIANLEVRNGPQQGIYVTGANNNLLFGIVAHSNHGSGIQLASSNNNRLEKIIAYNNFDFNNSRGEIGEDADGIGISSGDGNAIYNCVLYFNSDDGIDLWQSTNSFVDGCISFGNGRGANGDGNGYKLGGGIDNASVIQRSIAFSNRATGFTSNGGRQVHVINNTSFGNSGANFQGASTTTFRNNISDSGSVSLNGGSSQNNSWDLGLGSLGFASTTRTSDLFLSLSSGSPARNAGSTNVSFSYEGSAPDLGALQYPLTWVELLDNAMFDMAEGLARVQ